MDGKLMIRRALATGLLAGLVIAPALEIRAQILPMILFKKAASAPSGYTGPGDVVSGATAFWSPSRAYSAATRGTNAMLVCDGVTTATCVNVASDAITGIVPVPNPTGVLPCNNSTDICTIQTLYDQTGNGHDTTNATIATRPILSIGVTGSSQNAAVFSADLLESASTVTLSQPITYSSVAQLSSSSIKDLFASSVTADALFGNGPSTNSSRIIAGGTISVTATSASLHSFQSIFNSASSFLVVDGVASSGNAGAAGLSGRFCIGGNGTGCGSNQISATMFEDAVYNFAFNSTQYGAMNTNMASFY